MRYLLNKKQLPELVARQEYLYDIFRLYFLPGKPEGSYIPLIPVGTPPIDLLFITGHVYEVREYLDAYISDIPEKGIVITSCFGYTFLRHASKKEIYVPISTSNLCHIRNGQPYGFNFNISDAELDFYNAQGDVMERILKTYRCL